MTELTVLTFKEGLLSRVAHDLKLVTEQVEVHRSGEAVTVSIAADSFRVRCAMKRGREDHRALSASQREEIEVIIAETILDAARHPTVRFSGEIRDEVLSGTLTVRGVSQPVSLPWRITGGEAIGEITLDQRRFGITPYRAMMGALKLKPELRVSWRTSTA